MNRLLIALLLVLPLMAQSANTNPYISEPDIALGRQYFLGYCASCHAPDGTGGRGVTLTTGVYRHGSTDRNLFNTIRFGIPGSEMFGSRLMEAEVWKLVAYVRRLGTAGAQEKSAGDAHAGQTLYHHKGACASCHAISGKGGSLGPDLTEIGLRRTLKFLRDSLTDPDAFVAEEYRTAAIVTRSGQSLSGVRLNEDDYSIQIRDTSE